MNDKLTSPTTTTPLDINNLMQVLQALVDGSLSADLKEKAEASIELALKDKATQFQAMLIATASRNVRKLTFYLDKLDAIEEVLLNKPLEDESTANLLRVLQTIYSRTDQILALLTKIIDQTKERENEGLSAFTFNQFIVAGQVANNVAVPESMVANAESRHKVRAFLTQFFQDMEGLNGAIPTESNDITPTKS